jgi:hypothetical protein
VTDRAIMSNCLKNLWARGHWRLPLLGRLKGNMLLVVSGRDAHQSLAVSGDSQLRWIRVEFA